MLVFALFTPNAAACGGFFCNNIDPIEQRGEKIVFEVKGDRNETTMHVQVEYQGPPTEFAWVIPVRGEPDLAISNEALFTVLDPVTEPRFVLEHQQGDCNGWWGFDMLADDANGIPAPPPEAGGVDVIAEQQIGPYDTAVLAAQDTQVLLQWLQDNGYSVPNGMASVMAPYLADGHNFVALKLASGNDTGDLAPLAMTYSGTVPAIPLHLTSVAAAPDMPLTVYVLGEHRAVPDNYLHVEINYAAIDWFSWWQSNYDEVVTRAADQAGGHAFATDYSGNTTDLAGRFYPEGVTTEQFAVDSAQGFLEAVTNGALPPSRELLDTLEQVVPIPAGTDARSVYNCPSCYSSELATWFPTFDGAQAAATLDANILQPLRDIEAMFERQPHLTRLSSSVSPEEMTVDPMFTMNADIEQYQPNVHTATVLYHCEEDTPWDEVTATLILPDHNMIELPSYQTLNELGMYDQGQYLDSLQEPAASRIEDLGSEGPPTVLFDGRGEIESLIDELNEETHDLEGHSKKGCSTTGGAGLTGLFLVLPTLLVGRRRR